MKTNTANFITATALACAGLFLTPPAAAEKQEICVRHTGGGALFRMRVVTTDYKHATKWSSPLSYGLRRCADVSHITLGEDVKFRAEVKPVSVWGDKLVAHCPEGFPTDSEKAWRASADIWGAECVR